MGNDQKYIGYTCAYTPVHLIEAAGFIPYRVLPLGDWPDQAGRIMHDNLCPNVKRILDRAMADDIPDLAGMVFMNSCDAMRRLADAWKKTRPDDDAILVDLPTTMNHSAISFFKEELSRLTESLSHWADHQISSGSIDKSIEKYNELSGLVAKLNEKNSSGAFAGGSSKLQSLYNRAVTEPVEDSIKAFKSYLSNDDEDNNRLENIPAENIPIFLFGNVLPDPEVFSIIESCGARIVSEDMCTGSRMFTAIEDINTEDRLFRLAHGILTRPACARTIDTSKQGKFEKEIITKAKFHKARGIIGHTIKFCDPYILRMPAIRKHAQDEGFPILLLEGDCTLRSIGQHRTRIEAFIEMLR